MSAINFPDPSQSPWENPSTGITYTYSNGVWKALNSTTEQFVRKQDGGVQQVISGGGGLNIIGDVKSNSKTIPTAVMGENAPANPGVCDFWTDTSSDPPVLKTWNGTEWTALGSGGGGGSVATTIMGPIVTASNSGYVPSVLTGISATMNNATIQVTNWYKDSILIPGENGPQYTATEPGVYKYEERYLDSNGALVIEEYSATIQILAISTPSVTSPANDASLKPNELSFSSSAPVVTSGTVTTWGNADWQLAEDSGFTTHLQSSTSPLTSSGSQSGPTDFTVSALRTYYTRTRYNSSVPNPEVPSDWSNAIQFATGPLIDPITSYSEVLSNTASEIEGELTHNGYGFMLYTGYKVDDYNYTTILDVTNIPKVRFVLIGGGGGGADVNITCAGASGGIEGWIDTSNISQLKLAVGGGGAATCSTVGGDGGDSGIFVPNGSGGWTRVANAYCGRGIGGSGYDSVRRGTEYNSSWVTPISRAKGGLGGAGTGKSDREPIVELSPTLPGAHAHGACSGAHGANLSNDVALGYGGGGPGTYSSNGSGRSPGGPLGYRGGSGTSNGGETAQGPVTNYGTSYGRNSINCSGYNGPLGGGGGGAFGAPGMEVYDVGEGATGLVKVWWASNTGDETVLTTVGDLYN